MKKDVMLLTGAGQIGMAIARRMGYGMKIMIGDKSLEHAQTISKIMNDAGFDTEAMEMDLSSRVSIRNLIAETQKYGEIAMLVNAAGVSPSIIVTPLAMDEFKGPRGDFYKNMFAKCPAGRPGTADEVANVAELLLGEKGRFITGADFLIDGGATASYFYGPLKP